jgi:hypothetical protein
MCENMAISDGHYIESGNCLVADEEKGRHILTTHVSYLGKGRAPTKRMSHILVKRDTHCVGASRISGKWTTPLDNSCGASMGTLEHMCMCTNGHTPTTHDPSCGAHVV